MVFLMPNIKIFYPSDDKEHMDVLRSFNVPLNVPMIDLNEGYSSCEICVTFGVPKKYGHRGELVKKIFDEHKGRHLVIEKGYIKRDVYYAIGWDGLNGRANFNNKNSPTNRWDQLNLSGFKTVAYNTSSRIIVCGQVPWDASVQHINFTEWCIKIIEVLKDCGDVVFRPHPLDHGSVKIPDVNISTISSFRDDLLNAKACITFNSNCGVEAFIEGVPVFSFDKGSMVWDVSSHDLNRLNSPYNPDIVKKFQWGYDIAYTQWTKEEMREGLPHKHLGVFK